MKRKEALGRYRKMYVRVWGDEKFNKLTPAPPNAQTLWFRLLFPPEATNIPGLFCASESHLCEKLKWSLRGLRVSFTELVDLRMVKVDWRSGVIWIPRAIEYHQPESPNVVRSWRHAWNEIPECRLKWESYVVLERGVREIDSLSTKPDSQAFLKAFHEALPAPYPEVLEQAFADSSDKPLTQRVLEGLGAPFGESEAEAEAEAEAGARAGVGAEAKTPTAGAVSPLNRPGKGRTQAPKFLPVTRELQDWASKNEITVNLEAETESMLDHFRGSGEYKHDWEATRRNWLRRAQSGNFGRGSSATTGIQSNQHAREAWGGKDVTF